jgi:hypothetical protein
MIVKYNHDGIDLFASDWDNLILLDGCRYDISKSVTDLPKELQQRESKASNTVEFLEANIAGHDLHDTVYITANPQFRQLDNSFELTFHAVIDLWDRGWDKKVNTVCPEVVTSAAIDANEQYPNKRLLIHYNQPHVPFIGEIGREIIDLDAVTNHPLPFWQQPMSGCWDIDDKLIQDAYRENLELTITHVESILRILDGKTVITIDHGNMIGDCAFPIPIREYGHPRGIYTPELTLISWLITTNGSRKKLVREQPTKHIREVDMETVEDRLDDLEYN